METIHPNRLGGPAGTGDRYSNGDHLNHLVLFFEPAESEIDTKHGHATVAQCESVACVDCNKRWAQTPIFGQAMVPALVDAGVRIVAGRITQGQAANGRSAPWFLGAPSDIDLATAEDFINGSGAIHTDDAPPYTDADEPAEDDLEPTDELF